MPAKPVLIVGSIALDTIEASSGSRTDILGGSSTYAMIAASSGNPVHIVGIVGEDFPESGFDIYQHYAEDLADLTIASGTTFRWGGRYHGVGDVRDTLFTKLGVFEGFSPQLSDHNRSAPFIYLANIQPDLQLSVLEQCEGQELVAADTMNLWITTAKESLIEVLKHIQVLFINESEATLLTGENDLERTANILHSLGPETIVVKRGSLGAVLFSKEGRIFVDVYPVPDVVDPTGAGDTFGGAVVSTLARGKTWQEALITGSAMASVCIEGFGVEALLAVTREEIQKRKDFLRKTITVIGDQASE